MQSAMMNRQNLKILFKASSDTMPMAPSNGFQMAQTLTQMEKHPLVIFVTKRHEYAVQGYGIAFRYLVKPLDESLFAAAMDAVVQELDSKHFTVEYEGATLSLETSDIYYLESHGHKVLIHCKG